ncbi:hypothetical protein CWC29_014325 [Pseudoalteromonas sp. S4498]|uniref:hypothetical protein n=1 Tax=Pseudoalteromonas galatheae TaxID=579562 RepID=UPI0011094095|nr:hypothetical protein [Pseudoalteromonas galatheae]NKC19989.1 hypothetical protein [Pseudoalteromonas galatheae]
MKIDSFDDIKLDPAQYSRAKQYFLEYYQGPFIYGQGVEELLKILECYGTKGSWLDLGSGPSTLLWSIPLSGITSITCSDKHPEMLLILRNFVCSRKIPKCYKDVLEICSRNVDHLADMRKKFSSYYEIDALRPWHGHALSESFDLVTEFGCFGISPSAEAFIDCVGYVKPAITPGGRFIGANWVRSNHYVSLYGGKNSYLCTELIVSAAEIHDMELLHAEMIPVKGDPYYDAVIVWVLNKKRI